MNAPTLSRICAQSGSSFGSNTTHLRAAKQALLDEQRQPPHGNVLVVVRDLSPRRQRAGAPRHGSVHGKIPEALIASGLSTPFSPSVSLYFQPLHARQRGLHAGRSLPHAAGAVGAGIDTRHRAACRERARTEVVEQRPPRLSLGNRARRCGSGVESLASSQLMMPVTVSRLPPRSADR